MIPSDETGLELVRAGTRFAEPSTEAAYRLWQREYSVPFNRAGLGVSLVSWLGVVLLVLFISAEGSGPWLAAITVESCIVALALAASYRPAYRAAMPALTALSNLAASLLIAAGATWHFGWPELGVAGTVISIYVGFAVVRLRPLAASLGVVVGVLLDAYLLYEAYGLEGRSYFGWFVLQSAFVTGLVINVVFDVVSRQTYRQERIIEAQKASILRERARTEELLQREVAHQVAARSRDLATFLASSGESADARLAAVSSALAERYQVIRVLGAGAMGQVVEVERRTDGGRFALKLVSGEITGRGAARFAREAEIGARMRHENLVAIVDVGISHGTPFLVMELVPGGTLEQRRARFGEAAWALPILEQIAAALEALHAHHVVHRDLKPANVLLLDDGGALRAKVSDFGIASLRDPSTSDADRPIDPHAATGVAASPRSVDPHAPTLARDALARSPALTGTGVMLGTPLYMAPEAARGGREIGPAADVFAFGIVAYELLSGRMPFRAPPVMIALSDEIFPVPEPLGGDVPAPVAGVIERALHVDPTKRPSARELLDALRSRGHFQKS